MAKDTSSSRAGTEEPQREVWSRSTNQHVTDFQKAKSPIGRRVGAVILWLLGFAIQLLCVLVVAGDLTLGDVRPPAWLVVVLAVIIDAVVTLLGVRLWKDASDVVSRQRGSAAPSAGVVRAAASSAAFVPMVLFFLFAHNVDGRTRGASLVAALVAAAVCAVATVAL